ncbi:MAG: alpha/beta fold hydrolase [Deltaproteobacteria bacterium]|nr:alpha/beta fold hydrolase [Deltaproteobacteria bacterium]
MAARRIKTGRRKIAPQKKIHCNEKISAFNLRDEEIERYLVTGENSGLLEDYFGPDEYEEMRRLALRATGRRAKGPRVLILPGIMGSRLGKKRRFPIPDDLVWFDPLDIAAGRIADLALNSGKSYDPLGVICIFYLKLKQRLVIAGYDADFHPFDWRQGLERLGRELADRIRKEKAEKVHIVAHSMGGLVARAAFDGVRKKIGRLVMLGTPNFGSFVPIQCVRGSYSMVRKIAFLDVGHKAEWIAEKVLSTFPGLYQMLPSPKKFSSLDLFDPDVWPEDGPRPVQPLLKGVPGVQEKLAPGKDGFYLIAGVNRETVTGLIRDKKEFLYEISKEGDGTVPVKFAELPGAKTYYIQESHGSLPNNSLVARAVAEILDMGSTNALPDAWTPARTASWTVPESKLREAPVYDGKRGRRLSQREMRCILDEFVSPETHEDEQAPGTGGAEAFQKEDRTPSFRNIVVGRRRQHRIEVRLALGDIRETDAEALVLGVFNNVAPTGPARALDERLGGAISEFTERRMFNGSLGEVFMMPAGRHNLRADTILFVGLGAFDTYSGEVQKIAAENVVRTLVRSRVDDFATVLMGSGSGEGIASALYNLLDGFIRGIKDADKDGRLRRIILCEVDFERFNLIKEELFRLSGASLFEEVEVAFDEVVLPSAPEAVAPALRERRVSDPIYLIVRRKEARAGVYGFQCSVLGAGNKAVVFTGNRNVARADLDGILKEIESESFTPEGPNGTGKRLGEMILPPEVSIILKKMKERYMVVVHDADSSRIPWETVAVDGWFPAKEAGLSRRYLAENLSVAKWLEERRQDDVLNLLLVVNPTGDLNGASKEGERIRAIFTDNPAVKIYELREKDATKGALLRAFRSGEYDVIHYAGHAFFDAADPAGSGIICAEKQILSGRELAGIGNLPSLVFFNACEAARVRNGRDLGKRHLDMPRRIERNVGLAEAFLRGGVANYVGTYWPVGDEAAKVFSEAFYTSLLKGFTMGESLQTARKAIAGKSIDWADYVHYGDFNFALKAA